MRKKLRKFMIFTLIVTLLFSMTSGYHVSYAAHNSTEKGYVDNFQADDGTTYSQVLFINEANFPDKEFREAIIAKFTADNNSYIKNSKPFLTKGIIENTADIHGQYFSFKTTPYDLTGLEYFTGFNRLFLQASKNPPGSTAYDEYMDIANMASVIEAIKKMPKLTQIHMCLKSTMDISALDLSRNTNLEMFFLIGGNTPTLNFSGNTQLTQVRVASSGLTEQPKLPASIKTVDFSNVNEGSKLLDKESTKNKNVLKKVDFRGFTNLTYISCAYMKSLETATFGSLPEMKYLYLNDDSIADIDVSGMPNLEHFWLHRNHVPYYLDLTKINPDTHEQLQVECNRLLALDLPEKINEYNMDRSWYQNYRGTDKNLSYFTLVVDAPKEGEELKLDSYVPNFKYDRIVKDGSDKSIQMVRYKAGAPKQEIYRYLASRPPITVEGEKLDGISVSNTGITGVKPNTFITYWYDTGGKTRPSFGQPHTEKFYLPVLIFAKGYTVQHDFANADGANPLPNEILALKPADLNVTNGETVKPSALSKTEVTIGDDKWKFIGWNQESAQVNGQNITFIGTWKKSDKYNGSATFENSNDGDLPKEVLDLKPANQTVCDGAEVEVPATGESDTSIPHLLLLSGASILALLCRKNRKYNITR